MLSKQTKYAINAAGRQTASVIFGQIKVVGTDYGPDVAPGIVEVVP